MDELEERLTAVYGARYRHELDAAIADLPPVRSGWGAVFVVARQQLASDVSVLFGRGLERSSHRRLVLGLTAVAAVLVLIMTVTLILHGVFDDGPERFGRD
jgi:hypothetical protein